MQAFRKQHKLVIQGYDKSQKPRPATTLLPDFGPVASIRAIPEREPRTIV
jgi:hypothetical protein